MIVTPRILPLLALLRTGASLKQIAERFGMTTKSALRDLQALRKAGFRLTKETHARGKKVWYVRRLDATLKKLTT